MQKIRKKLKLTVKIEVHTDSLHHEFNEIKVHIPWISTSHDQLLIKRFLWDYGEPLLLIGLKITNPPQNFHGVVHSGISERNTLDQIFANYTYHLDTYFNILHAYEEMLEYMSTYVDTESDRMTYIIVSRQRRTAFSTVFVGFTQQQDSFY